MCVACSCLYYTLDSGLSGIGSLDSQMALRALDQEIPLIARRKHDWSQGNFMGWRTEKREAGREETTVTGLVRRRDAAYFVAW